MTLQHKLALLVCLVCLTFTPYDALEAFINKAFYTLY